ncbi:MAG: rhodanese-like domain-containing protein [bacterium]|nr:rhodanese-like domain-containing protein [bacterium]
MIYNKNICAVFLAIVIPLLLTDCCIKKRAKIPQQKSYSDITPQELIQKIERGGKFVLLDVRSEEEYRSGHIKDAILIPHTEIESRYKELGCKCREIVVYCRSGRRSVTASEALVRLGFGRVKNLIGGIIAWEKAGSEVIKD